MSRRIRLGESLIEAGLINNAQLEEALARKTTTGERIGEALVALGYITDRDLVRTLAKDANIPFLEADELHVDSTVVPLLHTALACDNNLVPLRADGRALVVAMSNPFDIAVIRLLERESGRQIRTVTADPAAIATLVAKYYGPVPGRISGVRNVLAPDGRPAWSRLSAATARDPVASPMPPAIVGGSALEGTPALLRSNDADAIPAASRGPRLDLGLPLAPTRLFAAMIDQDGVSLLEYVEEAAGFRILDQRSQNRRMASIEAAADAVVELLRETDARKVRLAIVLQQFGTVFQTSIAPSGTDLELTEAARAEVQRSFGGADARIAIARARNDGSAVPSGSWDTEPVFVAAAPTTVVDRLLDRLDRARVNVECLTVVPEIFRQLYRALDGSTEATAMLVCLHNGPHVAFFIDGRLELAIEPPPALAGDGPVQPAVILAQLERGATFLRQQAKGTVATRLLLIAPAGDHDALESAIEARTGMRVTPLGQAIGSPEAVVAMGAVLAARSDDRLDLSRRAMAPVPRSAPVATRSNSLTRMLAAAAVLAAAWCGAQLVSMASTQHEVERLEAQVSADVGRIRTAAQTARARELTSAVRTAMRWIDAEHASAAALLSGIANANSPAAQIDSLTITREGGDFRATLFGRSSTASGPAGIRAANELVNRLRTNPAFIGITLVDRTVGTSLTSSDPSRFTLTFLAPQGGSR